MRSTFIIVFTFLVISLDLSGQRFDPDLFCFEDAFLLTKNISFEDKAILVKKLGFDGIELLGFENAEEKLNVLEKYKLSVYMVYIQIDIDKEQAYDPALHDFIKSVSNKGVTLWLHIHSDKYKTSDPAGDELAVPIIQKLADYSQENRVNLALYPHSFFWLEKIEDSVRLTEKINRRNVGAVFNLCHFLRTDTRTELERKLIASIPFLSAVSINGADDGNTAQMDWDRLIQPLGEGSFDVLNVLRLLRDNRYNGPVGLQCYNIPGEPSVFLSKSVKTWNTYLEELNKK